jgi:hypothetical protein
MEKFFQSEAKQKVSSTGGRVGAGNSKQAAEKYLWHQGEEVVISTKGNHGYGFQGIETLSTQLIPTDVG